MGSSAPNNRPLFDRLTESVSSGRCIAVLGAGMSVPDYPIWDVLVRKLTDFCKVKPEDVVRSDPLDLAEAAQRNDPDGFWHVMRGAFAPKEHLVCATRYHLLERIGFASYLTLNFDPVLATVFSLHRNVTVSQYPWLHGRYHGKQELFYLHGRFEWSDDSKPPRVVLTRTEFEQAYKSSKSLLYAFLLTTFTQYDVCFLGCNPAQADMRKLLAACREIRESAFGYKTPNRPTWYLLVDSDSRLPKSVTAAGLELVPYDKQDRDYSGLDEILRYWARQQTPYVRQPGDPVQNYSPHAEPPR